MIPKAPPRSLRVKRARAGSERVYIFSYPIEAPPAPDLTPAELAVVRLVVGGQTRREIAESRGVAVSTVHKQIESAYKKLGVSSRSELAAKLFGGSGDG
ncbi:MAG: response regulator transcription factor [Polyangiaceae bacterium]|nr:response regulator transcription factor [Polyangiaceae bacterium]